MGFSSSLSISPNTASPVLKQNLAIQFDQSYETITDLSEYRVIIAGPENYSRQLNIVDWNDDDKKMIVKFNGAPSDSYSIKVEGPDGFIGAEIPFTTQIIVETIEPLQGSVLGGTLVTITGGQFGSVATDNPVKIGNHFCLVIETSDSQIKCRIQIEYTQEPETVDVIVFAKVSEEATCQKSDGCTYKFQESTTAISDITQSFDGSDIFLTVHGSGFTAGDIEGTQLWIEEIMQQCVSVDTTSAVFKLVDVPSMSLSDIKVYTKEGIAQMPQLTLDLLPQFTGVEPQVGSAAGTLITVTGAGFGVEQTNLNLIITATG